MSILYRTGVLAKDFENWGHLNIMIIPCLQFILAFAFSVRICSFIGCLTKELLGQIPSSSQVF